MAMANAFGQAIGTAMAANAPPPPAARINERMIVKDPERFSGSSAAKLRAFLVSCELVFESMPQTYREPATRIAFAVSYFTDGALKWAEPYFTARTQNRPLPDFLLDWGEFRAELISCFGEPRTEQHAETNLDTLAMKDSNKIRDYIITFNSFARDTSWNGAALGHRFYVGLPHRIKDKLVDGVGGRPTELNELRIRAQEIDDLHWARHQEKRKYERYAHSMSRSSGPGDSHKRSDKTSAAKASAGPPKKVNLEGKIDASGKLTEEEKERRRKNKLCFYCASPDHFGNKCPKAPHNTKGRSAELEDVPEESEDPPAPEEEEEEVPDPASEN
jgi:hypothetical protein